MEEELEETRAILAGKTALILRQQRRMEGQQRRMEELEGENRYLRRQERQKRKAEEESAEQERKRQRKADKEQAEADEEKAKKNAQRIRDLTPATALEGYDEVTIEQLKGLGKSIRPQVIMQDDNIFKGFNRNNHTHRILLSFEDLTLLLDAARAEVDSKNFHIE